MHLLRWTAGACSTPWQAFPHIGSIGGRSEQLGIADGAARRRTYNGALHNGSPELHRGFQHVHAAFRSGGQTANFVGDVHASGDLTKDSET